MYSKLKNGILAFLVFGPLISCTDKENKYSSGNIKFSDQVIEVNPEENEKILLSKFVRNYRIIELKANKENLIGQIQRFLVDINRIFILDRGNFFIYNWDGEEIKKIDDRGKGPNEYIEISNFDIDLNKKLILLFDQKSKTIHYYDYLGKYIKKREMPLHPSTSFASIDGERIALFLENRPGPKDIDCNVLIVDGDGAIVEGFIPIGENLDMIRNNFSRSGKYISFTYALNDTIYGFNNGDFLAKYYIDFGDSKFENEFAIKQRNDSMRLSSSNYAFSPRQVKESDSYLFFTFLHGSYMKQVVYDKQKNKIYNGMRDDIGLGFRTYKMDLFNGKAFGIVDAINFVALHEQLKNNLSNEKYRSLLNSHPQIAEVLSTVQPEGNPLFIIIDY